MDQFGNPIEGHGIKRMIQRYLSESEFYAERLRVVEAILTDKGKEKFHEAGEFCEKVKALSEDAIFDKNTLRYLMTNDLSYLKGMSDETLISIREIREAGYTPELGPNVVRFVAAQDYTGMARGSRFSLEERFIDVRKGEELGRIALVSREDLEEKIHGEKININRERYSRNDMTAAEMAAVNEARRPRRPSARMRPYDWAPMPGGYVIEMENKTGRDMRLILTSPEDIEFKQILSWSAEILIPSSMAGQDFGAGLDIHTSIPEQSPGASWFAGMGLRSKPSINRIYAFGHWNNKNTDEGYYKDLGVIELDTWYNLRIDFLSSEMNSAISEDELWLVFYLNGKKVDENVPTDSEILLDPGRTLFGPKRSFSLGKGTAYIDNVMAVYINGEGQKMVFTMDQNGNQGVVPFPYVDQPAPVSVPGETF